MYLFSHTDILSYFLLSYSSSLMIISSYPKVALSDSQCNRDSSPCQDRKSVDRWILLMAPVSGWDETSSLLLITFPNYLISIHVKCKVSMRIQSSRTKIYEQIYILVHTLLGWFFLTLICKCLVNLGLGKSSLRCLCLNKNILLRK